MKKILLLAIISFFSYTFINKLMNVNSFLLNIAQTNVFNVYMVNFVALYALLSELICIVMLAFKEKVGSFVSLFVMLSYTLYLIYLGANNRYEICGCGGILNGLPFLWHLLINLLIIISLLYLCIYERKV